MSKGVDHAGGRAPDLPGRERRSTERFTGADHHRVVIIAGGRSYDCVIEDVSRGGLRLRLTEPAPLAGQMVVEHVAAGFFRAKRVWARGNEMAIAFANETGEGDALAHTLRIVRILMAGAEPGEG